MLEVQQKETSQLRKLTVYKSFRKMLNVITITIYIQHSLFRLQIVSLLQDKVQILSQLFSDRSKESALYLVVVKQLLTQINCAECMHKYT